jgi:hypothetical protein
VKLKKSWWMRGWVIALAALIVGVVIGSAGGKAKTVTVTRDVAGPVTTDTTTETATATVTTTPTKVVATRTVKVTVTFTPPPASPFSDGQYLVGPEVKPGVYHTSGEGGCYYARLANLNGAVDSIIVNDNISGPTTIEISSSDKAIQVSGGCTWAKIG